MKDAFIKAFDLIMYGNSELGNIIGTTLKMSIASSLIALLIGVPLGILLAYYDFKGKKILTILNRTLTGVPPVVCGLLCYMLFSGVGPLGFMHLLFSIPGMIIAQVLLITPVIVATTETFVVSIAPKIKETTKGLGIGNSKAFLLTVNESKYQIVSTYLLGFSRAIAEVGAVSMVGGAIAWKTNVMTTAIMQYTNMGDFSYAMALGIVLLVLALIFNIAVYFLQARLRYENK